MANRIAQLPVFVFLLALLAGRVDAFAESPLYIIDERLHVDERVHTTLATWDLPETRAQPHAMELVARSPAALHELARQLHETWYQGDFPALLRADTESIVRADAWVPADDELWTLTRDALLLVVTAAIIEDREDAAEILADAMLVRYDADFLCDKNEYPEACALLSSRHARVAPTRPLADEDASRFSRHCGRPLIQLLDDAHGLMVRITDVDGSTQVHTLSRDEPQFARHIEGLANGTHLRDDERRAETYLRETSRPLDGRPALQPTLWATTGALSLATVGAYIWRDKSVRSLDRCVAGVTPHCRGSSMVTDIRRQVVRSNISAWTAAGLSVAAAVTSTTITLRQREHRDSRRLYDESPERRAEAPAEAFSGGSQDLVPPTGTSARNEHRGTP